jgi:CRISPR-associated protein Csd1
MSILAALAKAYDRFHEAPPFGYSNEKIGFVISLHEDGTVASVTDLRDGSGRKKLPRTMQVPQPKKRTSAIAPNFLWDKTSYALGITKGERKRAAAEEHTAFVEAQLGDIADSDDAGFRALAKFLTSWSPDQFVAPLWPDEMKDQNVVFALESDRLGGAYLHTRDAAKAIWAKKAAASDTARAICLVSGDSAPMARLHPSIRNVWGSQSAGASIVSFNKESFRSYGHDQGDNAPVSEAVAFKYTTALNLFLAGRSNRVQIGNTSTVFWADASDRGTASAAEDVFGAMFGIEVDEIAQAERVGDILNGIRRGKPLNDLAPDLDTGVRFYVLGLAPNAARISIRFWYENDFGVLARNYQRFVADMKVDPPPPRDEYPALWKYLAETAVLGKRENVQPNLAGEWMRSILEGTRYPLTLLSSVITRIRADGNVNALRAGMLRALLVRNFGMEVGNHKDKTKEAPVSLDPSNRNKGYLLGRLFAAYEQAQTAALGRNINATIKDKFYGAASAQPRKVFALLEKGSANHLSKIGKSRPGQRVNLEKTIGGILEGMSPESDPFPASLPAEDQALFGLGYYHQRNEFFRKPVAADPEGIQS